MRHTVDITTCGDLGRELKARAEAAPLRVVCGKDEFGAGAEFVEEGGVVTLHLMEKPRPHKRKRKS